MAIKNKWSQMKTSPNRNDLSKRAIYLLLAIIIIWGALNNVSNHFIYGFNSISFHDEISHFARAKSIALGENDIFHQWDRKDYYDLYPPGLHIVEAAFMNTAGVEDIYTNSFIFKLMLMAVILLLYFMIGAKISPAIGLGASFFRGVFFFVRSQYESGYYTNLSSYFGRPDPCMYTEIFILMTVFFIIGILKMDNIKSFKAGIYLFLLFVASILHGLTHFGTYVSYLFEFPLVLLGFIFISINKFNSIKFKENIIPHVMMIVVILLSIPVLFFLYYYPMWSEISGEKYTIINTLDIMGIPQFFKNNISYIFIFIILLSFLILLFVFRYSFMRSVNPLNISKKKALFIVNSYVILYFTALGVVTYSPTRYHYGGVAFEGIFPIFIPTWISNQLVTIPTLIVGFIMFGMSVIGLWYAINSKFHEMKVLGIMYFLLYFGWMFSFFVLGLHPSRAWLFRYILPFLYVNCIMFLWEKEFRIFRVNFTKIAAISIVLLFIFTSFIITINKEAWIRSSIEPTFKLKFGNNSNPQTTPEFIAVVDSYVEDENILGTSKTLEVMGSTTDAKVLAIGYSTHIKDNVPIAIERRALITEEDRKYFFRNYNSRYLIVPIGDLNDGDISKYNQDINLIKVYQGSYDQSIYYYSSLY